MRAIFEIEPLRDEQGTPVTVQAPGPVSYVYEIVGVETLGPFPDFAAEVETTTELEPGAQHVMRMKMLDGNGAVLFEESKDVTVPSLAIVPKSFRVTFRVQVVA